jgi:hypothetical protein
LTERRFDRTNRFAASEDGWLIRFINEECPVKDSSRKTELAPNGFGSIIAGGLATFATVLELIKGDVCPVAFGNVPMCYISLAMSVLIGGLFWSLTR